MPTSIGYLVLCMVTSWNQILKRVANLFEGWDPIIEDDPVKVAVSQSQLCKIGSKAGGCGISKNHGQLCPGWPGWTNPMPAARTSPLSQRERENYLNISLIFIGMNVSTSFLNANAIALSYPLSLLDLSLHLRSSNGNQPPSKEGL